MLLKGFLHFWHVCCESDHAPHLSQAHHLFCQDLRCFVAKSVSSPVFLGEKIEPKILFVETPNSKLNTHFLNTDDCAQMDRTGQKKGDTWPQMGTNGHNRIKVNTSDRDQQDGDDQRDDDQEGQEFGNISGAGEGSTIWRDQHEQSAGVSQCALLPHTGVMMTMMLIWEYDDDDDAHVGVPKNCWMLVWLDDGPNGQKWSTVHCSGLKCPNSSLIK